MLFINFFWNLNMQTILIFLVVFLFIYNFLRKESWRNLPPGPPCLPLLGSLPFLGYLDIREALSNLRDRYGEVSTLYLGQTRAIILNSHEAIKEALQTRGEIFGARPPIFFVKDLRHGQGM